MDGQTPKKYLTASHASELPTEATGGWYHLLPAGKFSGRDGRGPYVLNAAQMDALIQAFARLECDLPVDYEHQMMDAKDKSGPVPAAGWIKELASRSDGLWGRVEWTPAAQECLTNKEYRYISPVFVHDKGGRIQALTMAALTNTPNLYLTAAASRHNNGGHMSDLARVVELLGLSEDATEDDVIEAINKLKTSENTKKDEGGEAQSEGEGEGEKKEDEESLHSKTPDPSQYVPMSLYQELNNRLTNLEQTQAKKQADTLVSQAMSAGKITPAQKDWAVVYASRDPKGFGEFVSKAPVIVSANAQVTGQTLETTTGALTAEQRQMAVTMGIKPEAYLKTLQSEKKEA
jgi:phage I-like protein